MSARSQTLHVQLHGGSVAVSERVLAVRCAWIAMLPLAEQIQRSLSAVSEAGAQDVKLGFCQLLQLVADGHCPCGRMKAE